MTATTGSAAVGRVTPTSGAPQAAVAAETGGCPPRTSVIVVNYNGKPYLQACLSSLLLEATSEAQIIVIDNASDDGSAPYVEQSFPQVQLLRSARNLGFGGAANLAVQQTRGRYLVFLNPDTVVEPGWLAELVRALEEAPAAGLATPKIVMMDDPQRINACGNDLHLTGLTLCRGLDAPRDAFKDVKEVSAVSGAAFAIRRELFQALGGFDPTFFMYMEDTDLSWRARMAGQRCICVPRAVVRHDYALRFGPRKVLYQERNRYQMWLKGWHWGTWCLLLPVLLLAEAVTWGYVLLRQPKQASNKLRAYAWIARHWGDIMARRRQTQALRRVRDRELLAGCTWRLDFAQFDRGALGRAAGALLNPLFYVLHRAALSLMRW
jgi:GT2 family glycosyltransferase